MAVMCSTRRKCRSEGFLVPGEGGRSVVESLWTDVHKYQRSTPELGVLILRECRCACNHMLWLDAC